MRIGQKTEAKRSALAVLGAAAMAGVAFTHCKSPSDAPPASGGAAPAGPQQGASPTPAQNPVSPQGGPTPKLTPEPTPKSALAQGEGTDASGGGIPMAASGASPKAFPSPKPVDPGENLLLLSPSLMIGKQMLKESVGGLGASSEITDTSRDEQLTLFPAQALAVTDDLVFYQRRYSSGDRFGIFMHSEASGSDSEIMRSTPSMFDAFAYCPMTDEIVFQAPPIDNSGKFVMNGRPRRVYLFSLKTGTMSLVWRRQQDRNGTISPRMSVTPDCQHLLVNLELETEGNRIPYGELLYLRRPRPNPKAKNSVASDQAEWTLNTIALSGKNGVTKHYGEALFVQPQDPARYKPSGVPPPVLAVLDMDNKVNTPIMYAFEPSGSSAARVAGAIRWRREKVALDRMTRSVVQAASVSNMSQVVVLTESQDKTPAGDYRRALGLVDVTNPGGGIRPLVESDAVSFRHFHVHPSGTRLAASYVQSMDGAAVEALSDKRIAGLLEVRMKDGKASVGVFEQMLPFHALQAHHVPRPRYSSGGSMLYFSMPDIPELADASMFTLGTASNKEIQYPVKILKRALK